MPEKIIKKFQDEYGKKKGKSVFYATANKQKRDPETFHKEDPVDKAINHLARKPKKK